MPPQRLNDAFGRQPLVNEEGQSGHVERQSLGLARPVQKRLADGLETLGGILGLLDRARLQNIPDECLASFTRMILPVPIKRG